MNKVYYLTALLIAGIFLNACNNNNDPQPFPDVIVDAGYNDNGPNKYYRDGAWTNVNYGRAGTLFADGNDIYYPVYGGYRKNDVMITLPGAADVNTVYVKNGVVYATGIDTLDHGCLWTGSAMAELIPGIGGRQVRGRAIYVDAANQVHVGGTVYGPANTGTRYMFHWTNNTVDTVDSGILDDMVFRGSEMHITGFTYEDGKSGYWVNGLRQDLRGLNGTIVNDLTSLSVWGNDVYVTANDGGTLYWKNGQPQTAIGQDLHPLGVVVDQGRVVVGVNRGSLHGGGNYYMELWMDDQVQSIGEGVIYDVHARH